MSSRSSGDVEPDEFVSSNRFPRALIATGVDIPWPPGPCVRLVRACRLSFEDEAGGRLGRVVRAARAVERVTLALSTTSVVET
jgi:hypothetical protein